MPSSTTRPKPFACSEFLALLTPAERMVVIQLYDGLANKEIGAVLGKSQSTVKAQLSSAMAKLGVPTRTRLIALLQS